MTSHLRLRAHEARILNPFGGKSSGLLSEERTLEPSVFIRPGAAGSHNTEGLKLEAPCTRAVPIYLHSRIVTNFNV